jgi:PAS domain S-box-containing protein
MADPMTGSGPERPEGPAGGFRPPSGSGPDAAAGVAGSKVSLHVRVLGIACFFLVVLFGLAYLAYDKADHDALDERATTRAQYLARVVGLLVEKYVATKDQEGLKDGLARLVASERALASLRLRMLHETRELYFAPGNQPPEPFRFFENSERCFDSRGREVAALTVGFWQRGFIERSEGISVLNTIIAVDVMVMFGVFLHLLLRELVTRPLENFVELTRKVADGDLNTPVMTHAGASREEERLAQSFDEMIQRLRASREELSRVNKELEERVIARTDQLRQAKAASDTVIATVADGLYTVDGDRRIKVFNSAAEALTGLKAADVLGLPCYEVLRYPWCQENCILQRLFRGRSGPVRDASPEEYLEELSPDGRTWLVSGSLFSAPGDPEKFAGGVETIKDLSGARKLQQQIRQMDKLTSLGVLSAGVAHEINNPLSNIKMYAQLLQEDLGAPAAPPNGGGVIESIGQIIQETDRASSIVRKMLEFSRHSKAEIEEVAVTDIVESSLDMVRYMLGTSGVALEVAIDAGLPPIRISRVGLQQVLVNLFNNAWQAMREGGTLRVRAWLDTKLSRVVLSISDSGTGIPTSDLSRIFDPFFTTKDVGEGTGLGLSISYGIIQELRGELVAESTPGKGTTFKISLPVQRQA